MTPKEGDVPTSASDLIEARFRATPAFRAAGGHFSAAHPRGIKRRRREVANSLTLPDARRFLECALPTDAIARLPSRSPSVTRGASKQGAWLCTSGMQEGQTHQRAKPPTWDDVVAELAERIAPSSLLGPLQLAVDIYLAGPPDTAGTASITDADPDTADLLFALNTAITQRIGGPGTSIVRQVARRWRGTPQRVEIRLTQLIDPPTQATPPRELLRERLQIAQTV